MKKTWSKIPVWWVRGHKDGVLHQYKPQTLGESIAALILYALFCIRVAEKDAPSTLAGSLFLTFSNIEDLTGLSRHLISRGIRKLQTTGLIEIEKIGRNNRYTIIGYNDKDGPKASWGKLPRSYLYDTQGRLIFSRFSLRFPAELYALKLYYLIIASQSNQHNCAMIGYDKLNEHSGVPINKIRSGLSHLVNLSLIHIDRDPIPKEDKTNAPNQYRVCGVDPKRHQGTIRKS